MKLDALNEDDLRARSSERGEPEWLRDRRLVAYKRYLDQAWPDSHRDEFWRSTPFDRRIDVEREIVESGESSAQVPASLTAAIDGDHAVATFVDGRLVDVDLPTAFSDLGVIVTDLVTASRDHAGLVERYLGTLTTSAEGSSGSDEDRTITVNDAAWTDGVFIHVPPEVEIDGPISVHVHAQTPGAHLPRVLAVVGHHAKATVYLEHTAPDVDVLVNEVVEVIAEDSSTVRFASVQDWNGPVQHLGLHKVAAHRDSTVRTLTVTTGGATVRLRPEVDLVGPGATARPLGLYFANEGQWFDLQPYVRHIAPHAKSDVLFKGALQGRSRTVFRGNVYVHRDAVGTATDENNRSLILTEGARADSTPFLEIECSDITAGHGSATGQIDALQLFYLESRGLRREEALRLIVYGFFTEVLGELDLPGISKVAQDAIESRVEAVDLSAIQINDASLRDEGGD